MSVVADVAGKTVLDLLWERLDAFVDELMAPAHEGGELERAERKGHAYGMAEAIALVNNPYHPDVDAVRGEAMERWEQRQELRTPNERTDEPTTMAQHVARAQRRAARRARREARNG